MTSNDLKKAGIKLGQGWRLNTALTGEAVLVQKVARDKRTIRWYAVKNEITTAVPAPPPSIAGVSSVVYHERELLIYFREQGIAGYGLLNRKEELLVSLDTNLYRARGFWLDGKEDILYFIREKYSPPWDVLLANLQEHKGGGMKVRRSLLAYSFRTGTSRLIADFEDGLGSSAVDARSGVFFAKVRRKILILDLHSGRILKELPEPDMVGICPTNAGKVMVWGQYSPAAYQIAPDGTRTPSDFKGLAPSFSSNGKKCAFWDRTGAFYVTGHRGKPEQALLSPAESQLVGEYPRPAVWCPCGDHLALPLWIARSGKRFYIALCALNIRTKTAAFCARNILDFNWQRLY